MPFLKRKRRSITLYGKRSQYIIPLWTCDEILSLLKTAREGDIIALENDRERISLFVYKNYDLICAAGITEMSMPAIFLSYILYLDGKYDLERMICSRKDKEIGVEG